VSYWFDGARKAIQEAVPEFQAYQPGMNDDFNADLIPLLGLHPASAAHGLNLQFGSCLDIYLFDIPWSNDLLRQLIARLRRRGQKGQVRVHIPRIIGTIDEVIWRDKGRKARQQAEFFGHYDTWLEEKRAQYGNR
jgi:SNF2 family DNA or RNA helicase